MNLLTDHWIPVLTASGQCQTIRVADLTNPNDPPLVLAADRADFNAALAQLLIALFQYAIAPDNDNTWAGLLHAPPTPDEVEDALSDLHDAFELEGERPFMQDAALDPSLGVRALESLLLESPGENALKNNTDLFIKRQSTAPWEEVRATLALLTLQINAPSGGQGHRTSLRGGGPLTTLVWPAKVIDAAGIPRPASLWQKLWCNILPGSDPLPPSDHHIALPWTMACITSEGARSVLEGWPRAPTQTERIALCGFATPRRVLLQWAGEGDERRCTGYVTRNYGANYPSDQFRHPASPYYRDAKGAWLPQHIGEAGFDYQHFTSYCTLSAGNHERWIPATIVAHTLDSDERRKALGDTASLWACGYAMDNMKVLAWHEAHYPLFPHLADENRLAFSLEADKLVQASHEAASQLGRSLRKFDCDAALAIRALRDQTEPAFYAALDAIVSDGSAEQRFAQRDAWLWQLMRIAMRQFDLHAERHVDMQSRLNHVEAVANERLMLWRSLNKSLHGTLDISNESPSSKAKPNQQEVA